jgi:hypothetical protein
MLTLSNCFPKNIILVLGEQHFCSAISKHYIDDIGTAETVDKAEEGYDNLKNLINNLGFEIAEQKCCSPSTSMIFLGKQFDSVNSHSTSA